MPSVIYGVLSVVDVGISCVRVFFFLPWPLQRRLPGLLTIYLDPDAACKPSVTSKNFRRNNVTKGLKKKKKKRKESTIPRHPANCRAGRPMFTEDQGPRKDSTVATCNLTCCAKRSAERPGSSALVSPSVVAHDKRSNVLCQGACALPLMVLDGPWSDVSGHGLCYTTPYLATERPTTIPANPPAWVSASRMLSNVVCLPIGNMSS